MISNKESRTQELDMLCIIPTTSKNISASSAVTITSEDSYANKNDTTFDLSSSFSVIHSFSVILRKKTFVLKLPIFVKNKMN